MKETNLRVFNPEGLRRFGDTLERLNQGASQEPELEWIFDGSMCQELRPAVTIQHLELATKIDAARTLLPIIRESQLQDKYYNRYLWSWLSAFYFDSVCPPDGEGSRKPGETYRHIPAADRNWRTVYRHLLAGPVRLYGLHETDIRILFHGAVPTLGDFVEQLMSRQEIAASAGILKAADMLYWDSETSAPKRGARATSREPGTVRRFIDVVQQLMLTYDLHSIDELAVLRLLPYKEFSPWMPKDVARAVKPAG